MNRRRRAISRPSSPNKNKPEGSGTVSATAPSDRSCPTRWRNHQIELRRPCRGHRRFIHHCHQGDWRRSRSPGIQPHHHRRHRQAMKVGQVQLESAWAGQRVCNSHCQCQRRHLHYNRVNLQLTGPCSSNLRYALFGIGPFNGDEMTTVGYSRPDTVQHGHNCVHRCHPDGPLCK